MEMLEYFFYMPVILRHVIQVDECIIQIDHNTDIQKVKKISFINCWKAMSVIRRECGQTLGRVRVRTVVIISLQWKGDRR